MAQELDGLARSRTRSPAGPVLIPAAVGELIDKIAILEIKSERIADREKLANVSHELDLLRCLRRESALCGPRLEALAAELKAVNLALWEIEDKVRICEERGEFGREFAPLARAVYKTHQTG